MADSPRENTRMLSRVERTYETALYLGDDGMWTVLEITKRPIFKAPSQWAANELISRLKRSDDQR